MKTAKNILGVTVALAMTVSGAFAAPSIPITSLPITASGNVTLFPTDVYTNFNILGSGFTLTGGINQH
jgi:hypothetical protein